MREILFRVYDTKTKSYREPIYEACMGKLLEFYINSNGRLIIHAMGIEEFKTSDYGEATLDAYSLYPDRFIVELYTGLNDKNGTRIFEGDIVGKGHSKFVVFYDEKRGAYRMKMIYDGEFYSEILEWEASIYKIIGNIHDNPELLKGSE